MVEDKYDMVSLVTHKWDGWWLVKLCYPLKDSGTWQPVVQRLVKKKPESCRTRLVCAYRSYDMEWDEGERA